MQTPHSDERAETLVAHFLAYSFLGKAFLEAPTSDLLTLLKEDALFADWPLESTDPELQAGLEILRGYCQQWTDADLQDLKRDYARLFVGPNRLLAPPWESVYRSEEHLLFDAETLQVRAMYRTYGFAIPGDILQPDDHFGLEMSFVAHLCRMGMNAFASDQAQDLESIQHALSAFFEEHISQWADLFLTDVQAKAATPYYQGLAQLASGCIAHTTTQWLGTVEAVSAS